MIKVLAIVATNHEESINKQLIEYTLTLVQKKLNQDVEIELVKIIDYELPFYRQDREQIDGIPQKAKDLYEKIGLADKIIISFAEHNGNYNAVYKNVFDWMSRIDIKVYQQKPMLLLSTSPGPGGAKSVISWANSSAVFFGMDVKASVSVPSFFENFQDGKLTNSSIHQELDKAIELSF